MVNTVKSAVSLDRELFQRAEALAGELHVSRSRLFSLAIEEFLGRHRNRRILEELNAAYADSPDPSEEALRDSMRRAHRRRLRDQW